MLSVLCALDAVTNKQLGQAECLYAKRERRNVNEYKGGSVLYSHVNSYKEVRDISTHPHLVIIKELNLDPGWFSTYYRSFVGQFKVLLPMEVFRLRR